MASISIISYFLQMEWIFVFGCYIEDEGAFYLLRCLHNIKNLFFSDECLSEEMKTNLEERARQAGCIFFKSSAMLAADYYDFHIEEIKTKWRIFKAKVFPPLWS